MGIVGQDAVFMQAKAFILSNWWKINPLDPTTYPAAGRSFNSMRTPARISCRFQSCSKSGQTEVRRPSPATASTPWSTGQRFLLRRLTVRMSTTTTTDFPLDILQDYVSAAYQLCGYSPFGITDVRCAIVSQRRGQRPLRNKRHPRTPGLGLVVPMIKNQRMLRTIVSASCLTTVIIGAARHWPCRARLVAMNRPKPGPPSLQAETPPSPGPFQTPPPRRSAATEHPRMRTQCGWWSLAAKTRIVAERLAKEQGKRIGEICAMSTRRHAIPSGPRTPGETYLLALLTLDALDMHDAAARVALKMITQGGHNSVILKVSFCSAETGEAAANLLFPECIKYAESLRTGARHKELQLGVVASRRLPGRRWQPTDRGVAIEGDDCGPSKSRVARQLGTSREADIVAALASSRTADPAPRMSYCIGRRRSVPRIWRMFRRLRRGRCGPAPKRTFYIRA